MIPWIDKFPKLQAEITRLAVSVDDPLWQAQGAEWSFQAHSSVAPDTAVRIDLSVTSSGDGEYETRYEPDPNDPTQQIAIFTGFREFVLNVRCSAYEADFERMALTYAERIRTNLQRNTVHNRIDDEIGVSFYRYGPIVELGGVEDGHALTVTSLDLFGYASFADDPTAAETVKMFTSITVTSKITGYVEGQNPNFTDTIAAPPTPQPVDP